jgi:plastocyanin
MLIIPLASAAHRMPKKPHHSLFFWATLCVINAIPSTILAQQITVTGRIELSRNSPNSPADSSVALVWLTPLGDPVAMQTASSLPSSHLVQRHKSFSPHLLVVQVGSSIEFPNRDPFFHNVFSLFEGKRFDLGLYEAGSSRSVVFDHVGISYIFCNIHPEMSAVVVALKTPNYAISDRKGGIVIPNVAPGRYEMRVWDERALPEALNKLTRTMVISESSHSFGVIHLTEQRTISQAHKNKYGEDYNNPTPSVPVYIRP